MRIIVLAGGRSAEHEISLISAEWVTDQLAKADHEVTCIRIERDGSWRVANSTDALEVRTGTVPWGLFSAGKPIEFDVIFPVLHGSFGEDGTIQGFCATAGWPCVGVPVMGSAIAMEKHTMKSLAANSGIPVVPWVLLDEDPAACFDCLRDEIVAMGLPLFVKPSRLGSSVGVSRVDTIEELPDAVAEAARYDTKILVEMGIEQAREIEVSVIGNGAEVISSIPGEVIPGREWYDFKAKYHCEESKLSIPAAMSASESENVRMIAEKAFRLIGGTGFARVDFLLNHSGIWLNEINTIPGFTEISMFPKLWSASGLEADELLNYILEEALNRREHGLWTEEE